MAATGFQASSSSAPTYSPSGQTTHSGGGQADATELIYDVNNVTTVAAPGDSAKLLPAIAGRQQEVFNNGANALDLYPNTGDNFIGSAANVAISIAVGAKIIAFCFTDGEWVY